MKKLMKALFDVLFTHRQIQPPILPSAEYKLHAEIAHLRSQLLDQTMELAESNLRLLKCQIAMKKVIDIGHNNDCILCGLKDKLMYEVLDLPKPTSDSTPKEN